MSCTAIDPPLGMAAIAEKVVRLLRIDKIKAIPPLGMAAIAEKVVRLLRIDKIKAIRPLGMAAIAEKVVRLLRIDKIKAIPHWAWLQCQKGRAPVVLLMLK